MKAKTANRPKVEIISLDGDNIHEQRTFCAVSVRHRQGYDRKTSWLEARFRDGLRYKLCQVNDRNVGFIEYIPGEYAWRGVDATGYLFIHCFWVLGHHKAQGYGSLLLQECLRDAQSNNYYGVAVATTNDTWLPSKKIFLKHGFEQVDAAPPAFELWVKPLLKHAPLPKFNNWKRTKSYNKGLVIIKSDQCPYIQHSIDEMMNVADDMGIPATVIHLRTYKEAQNAPCVYGVINILLNGELLSYHPLDGRQLIKLLQEKSGTQ